MISPEAEVRGLSVSVYSRLIQAGGLQPFLLDTQYRSHHKLAEFSSKAFYDGLLKSGIEDDQRTAPQGVPWPNSKCPIAFVNVDAQEELEGDSKANTVEAQMVASLVGKVLGYGELSVSQVGVVTPYVAQVRRLCQFLRAVLPPGADPRLLECASVDNFQGREKELIVFSAVRSNRAGNVGFLADWRRLNVMLTRARRGLLIFGNSATLKQDPIWEKWLAFAEEHECMVKDLPMPSPPPFAGKGVPFASAFLPGKGAKGFVKGMAPPRPFTPPGPRINPAVAAAQAARAAMEVSADLQMRAEAAPEVDVTSQATSVPVPVPVRPRPAAAPVVEFPALYPAVSLPQAQQAPQPPQPPPPSPEQLQKLKILETRLQFQQQQLQQKQAQLQQLVFVNPVQAQIQIQQLQQDTLKLQQQWLEYSQHKAELGLEVTSAPAEPSAAMGAPANHSSTEESQLDMEKHLTQLLQRELGHS